MSEAIQETTIDQVFVETNYSREEIMEIGRQELPNVFNFETVMAPPSSAAHGSKFRDFLSNMESSLKVALSKINHPKGEAITLDTPLTSMDVTYYNDDCEYEIEGSLALEHSDDEIYAAGIERLIKEEALKERIRVRRLLRRQHEAEEREAEEVRQKQEERSLLAQLAQKYPDEVRRLAGSQK